MVPPLFFRSSSMIDILYLAKGRPEFTEASLAALLRNTDWTEASLVIYTDGDQRDKNHLLGRVLEEVIPSMQGSDTDWTEASLVISLVPNKLGGPVAIMSDYLEHSGLVSDSIFAKIDNDVIVPPGWLKQCLAVMEAHPELDLLGIEPPASRTPAPWLTGRSIPAPEHDGTRAHVADVNSRHGWVPCDAIGGIGLMRRRAFANRPPMQPHGPNGVGGFTDWQWRNKDVVKGWIVPPLKVFLLDRLPVEPWASLSKQYIAEGIQRPWTNYSPEAHDLWDWWLTTRAELPR